MDFVVFANKGSSSYLKAMDAIFGFSMWLVVVDLEVMKVSAKDGIDFDGV